MNILYISSLSSNIAAGLNWSVPMTVAAQAEVDNVYWLNLTDALMEHWRAVPEFHNARELGEVSLDCLPEPFNRPDVVVFEGFYYPAQVRFAREVKKRGIPYVVTPRGSLTRQAQHDGWRKRVKKTLANLIMFTPYTCNAAAIQYLTEAEKRDSGTRWNKRCFVVPNGFRLPEKHKEVFSGDKIKAVFIGRLDMYHKGLDVLLEACNGLQDCLRKQNFSIDLYGPQKYDHKRIAQYINEKGLSDFIILNGEISGAEKERVLLDADLFLLPSRFEGHPMGLVEALAYGLPVLVTPGSNMLDEIQHTDSGWCTACTADAIAATLRKSAGEKHLLPVKSANARRLATHYDWANIARSFHSEIRNLLNN